MSGYFDNAFYNTNNNTGWDNLGNPMMYDPARLTPQNTNALSEEEIKHIAQKPVNKLDINISQDDNLRSMCTHKHNGQDMVRRIEDGSGDVYCPLCGARWSPNPVSEEELREAIGTVISQMQNAKWLGDLSTSLVRDYMPMIPLLYKFNDIFPYAMSNFKKYFNYGGGYYQSDDASMYSQWDALMGNTTGYTMPTGNPNMGVGNFNVPQQNMVVIGRDAYGNPILAPQNQYANAGTANPMQATFGVNPNAQNPQFVNQANNMMGGTVFDGSPAVTYANPNAAQQTVVQNTQTTPPPAPTYKPAEPPKTETTDTKVDL